MFTLRLNKNQGFSLVELAIGLAVVTVLILGISMSAGLLDNARVQSAANSVQTLRSAAENYLVTGKTSYTGMDVAELKKQNLLPSGFTSSKTNPWGGDYDVMANAYDSTRFDIVLKGLAKIDADKLTSYFASSAGALNFDEKEKKWVATF